MALRPAEGAMAAEEPEYLTTREVAALLRVRERKVYEMAASGELPARRLTGKLLFPRAEVARRLGGGAAARGEAARAAGAAAPAVVAGSHDPLLDWALRESGSGLAALFDGSVDGLARMARGEAVAAGVHLVEPEGGWNVGHVAERLGGAPVALVGWARRRRGLLTAPGLGLSGVAELRGRRVARRQPGAGGALLLDRLLAEAGLRPADLRLSEALARTETEAAAAVASGEADAALGLEAMARAFGLGFAPLLEERFDLVVDRRAWFEPPLQRLFAFARTDAFRAKAAALGGYDLDGLGEARWNGP